MLEVQTIRVDPASRRVWSSGEEVRLARMEFDLLHVLISNAGRIVSRQELMHEVWRHDFWTSSKTIDVHLGWLRRKIGDDPRRPHLITTIRSRGLRFELEPAVVEAEELSELQLCALRSRVMIEQAKGALAQQERVTPSEAFVLLCASARRQRRDLGDIAAEVIGRIELRSGLPLTASVG